MPAGGNSRFRGYPARMSERQQLALLLQMTSQEIESPDKNQTESSSSTSRSSIDKKSTKSRWLNSKNGESPGHRKEEFRRDQPMAVDYELEQLPKENEDNNSPVEASPGRLNRNFKSSDPDKKALLIDNSQDNKKSSLEAYQQQRAGGGTSTGPTKDAKESGDPCEMRRTPTQNKVDRSGSGQSGSSPRVTLRLNQVRGARDEKKNSSGGSRQSITNSPPPSSASTAPPTSTTPAAASTISTTLTMDSPAKSSPSPSTPATTTTLASSSTTSSAAITTTSSSSSHSTATTPGNNSSSTSDTNDVYEFKSSKEATPVRGNSTSPNPIAEKDKEALKATSQATSADNSAGSAGDNQASGVASSSTSGSIDPPIAGSPATKRPYDADNSEEQDEETRRKKRKESETVKDSKTATSGRQNAGRTVSTAAEKSDKVTTSVIPSSFVEQCAKTGKQSTNTAGKLPPVASATSSSLSSTTTTTTTIATTAAAASLAANLDRKSPNSGQSASGSPKPSNPSGGGGSGPNSKNGTPAPGADSDGDDERAKSSDSGSAPKVPPLKIVIPQSTAEQEQGNRNGKNVSTRGHQLPYVVASSNSNDSTDKEPGTTASGTTSPTDTVTTTNKTEDKKDFTGIIPTEERSTHHQRVLRSSHRSSNGGNTSASSKESSANQSGNGNYQNSSPLPASGSSADRSNNSSPQQRHNSPSPETTNADSTKTTTAATTTTATESTPTTSSTSSSSSASSTTTTAAASTTTSTTKTTGTNEKPEKNDTTNKNQKDNSENSENSSSSTSTTNQSSGNSSAPVELHPRKRKIKTNKESQQSSSTTTASSNESNEAANTGTDVHPHDQPITNCYQLFLNIRKQIERRRKGLFPVQPKPPQGFKDYLMNRCTYVLAGTAKEPNINPPVTMQKLMKDLYGEQEKERFRLRMQHVVEKEKLVLSVEQEILRVHGRAARALANQSLPFSVCTILKDEEVYNVITPEQEEKDRNARSRYNGRLFLSWLQDVDDKWEKIKEAMLLRHHNEAESLHAVQRMDWEWKLKEVGLCEFKATPQIEDLHVPIVHVSDDFDLLPA